MKLPKVRRILIFLFITFLTLGITFGMLYKTSPDNPVDIKRFQAELSKKESAAFKTLRELYEIYTEYSLEYLIDYHFENEDISYYVILDDELVFWSDNQLDIRNVSVGEFSDWHYIELPNAHCVILNKQYDNVNFIALITIKYNYPCENDKLVNRFAYGFDVDRRIEVKVGDESDEYAVFCRKGHYLFSLAKPEMPVYNENWSVLTGIFFIITFFLLFLIYAFFPFFIRKTNINLKTFLILFSAVGVFIAFLLFFNIPEVFFCSKYFSPFHFASNAFLSSICHLSVFTAFIFSSIYLFFRFVRTRSIHPVVRMILLLLYPSFFLLLYSILHSLVFHSSIQMNILSVNNFTVIGIWAHFLLLIWGIGLALAFFKTHNYFAHQNKLRITFAIDSFLFLLLSLACIFISDFRFFFIAFPFALITLSFYFYYLKKVKYNHFYLVVWCVIYAVFIGFNLLELTVQKNRNKYRVLAQNVYVNGNVENDRITDIMLEDLYVRLTNDLKIGGMILMPDSIDEAKEYLDKTYFRGFWNKYDVRLNVVPYDSDLYVDYLDYIEWAGNRIRGTYFYSVPTTQNAMTYIGVFYIENPNPDSMYYFLEFYPRREFKSYSFPDLLIPASANMHKQLNVSVAKYDNHFLTYSSGVVEYPADTYWIPEIDEDTDYTTVLFEDRWHYIYQAGEETMIVVSKQHRNEFSAYLQFFIYLAFAYFICCWLFICFYHILRNRNFHLGLAARFQYTFVSLLIVSFIGIFYVSIDFIKKTISNPANRKSY